MLRLSVSLGFLKYFLLWRIVLTTTDECNDFCNHICIFYSKVGMKPHSTALGIVNGPFMVTRIADNVFSFNDSAHVTKMWLILWIMCLILIQPLAIDTANLALSVPYTAQNEKVRRGFKLPRLVAMYIERIWAEYIGLRYSIVTTHVWIRSNLRGYSALLLYLPTVGYRTEAKFQ